jgi:hypothetical protein
MAIGDDFSIAANGDIRYVGSGATYTVIALHRWLQDLQDDAQAAGNDLTDITDPTSSERATDNLITLINGFNIDDHAARFLYDGSIVQASGATIYDGIVVLAPSGTYVSVVQNGKVITPNFWTTGLNADSTQGISHRFLVKVRTSGSDIDGRRLIVQTREWGKGYSEFKSNGTSRGNNVFALSAATDLNNATSISTVKSWTSITNTEGYRLIDLDSNGLSENYYSEWNRDTFTINQLFERAKWLSRRATAEATGTDTGSNFTVGNGTITGQAQSFSNGAVAGYVTRVFANLKVTGAPTGNIVAKIYAHSGTFGSSSVPTGGALATSVDVDVAKLSTSYASVEFGFDTQTKLSASTNYVVAFEYSGGNGSNYVQVQGLATTGTHAGNRSENTGSWAASATDDLNFQVDTSPELYEMTGELFRGITHEIVADTPSGTFQAVEPISWSGGTGQLLASVFPDSGGGGVQIDVVAASGTFTRASGSFITDGFRPGMTVVFSGFTNGGNNATKVISAVTATVITVTSITGLVNETGSGDERARSGHVWMQLLTGVAPTDNQTITGTQSSATCLVNVTVTERSLSAPFIGVSTGSALIGAYGIGMETGDVTSNDKFFDLTNTQRTPPNIVTFTVNGLVSGEDRVLVGPADGSNLDLDQLTLSTSLSGAAETAVVVTTTIPSDTPSSGTIRIQLNSGVYRRVAYTSFSGSTFTIASTDFTSDPASSPKNVFISYIDKLAGATSESVQWVYSSDRALFVRVRDGGGTPIKTFETTGTMGSAGGSSTAIRTTDA